MSTGNEVDFFNSSLPTGLTRYITSGGQVSVPSENLAFYFGGMRGQGWGPITSDDASANTTADTLIMLNLTAVGDQKVWRNSTLPKSIMSRADAQIIWVPVSDQGVLVVIGGVRIPEYLFPSGLSPSQQEQDVLLSLFPPWDRIRLTLYSLNSTPTLCEKSRCMTLRKIDGVFHHHSFKQVTRQLRSE